ncbi:GntR family transcriptional regulator [Lacticigenium naphthae]|uniref:GntR family transcriptional regulator n=1 Tax=Lacticigenium naphthae TaxID=515351 RepID=UPI0004048815|nr:GntR family transcriptional regulator [Lacticigenium naphthae]
MVKYKVIADEIRKRINQGKYIPETRLPNQNELVDEFNVSRVTIKKAIDLLTSAGLVYSIQGSGTYVKKNALNLSSSSIKIGQNVGLTTAASENLKLESKVLSFSVRFPTEEETERLLISSETPLYEIHRLRILDGKPYSIEYTMIPVYVAPKLSSEVLAKSLYNYLRKEAGIVFGDNRQTIKAARPTDLDKKFLNCTEMDPILHVEKIMFTENGSPFEFSVVHHRYDMVEMSFINSQGK